MLREVLHAAWRLRRFRLACYWLAFSILGLSIGPWIVPHDPLAQFTEVLIRPDGSLVGPFEIPRFWLGADPLGRDEFSRLVAGGGLSLAVAAMAAFIAVALGLAVGLSAGYLGGRFDSLAMRAVDFVLSLPFLLIAIALNRVFNKPGLVTLALLLGCLSWTSLARVVRARTLQVRDLGYVRAAKSLGFGPLYVMWHHVLPNVLAPTLVLGTTTLGGMVLVESAMSFLGLGIRPPLPTWGSMLRDGQELMLHAPHLVLLPGILIAATVFSLNLLGESLRDVLDARTR